MGPLIVKSTGSLELGFLRHQYWYRNGRSRPASPYHLDSSRFTAGNGNAYNAAVVNTSSEAFPDRTSFAYAQAHDRFVNRLGPKVQMAINALELGKTTEMVIKRLIQLRRLYTAVRRRDFEGVISSIADPDGKAKSLSRRHLLSNPSGFWLEIQFGWKPILSDIYTATEILQTPFPISRIRTRGKEQDSFLSFGWLPTNRSRMVQLSSLIRITNPNAFLANQLGVINPLTVAWDALPGSFIVDWFLPVNKFLNSFTAFVGIDLVEPQTARLVRGEFVMDQPGETPIRGDFYGQKRELGVFDIPSFTSRMHLPKVDSWLLATTSALSLQALSRRL